MIVEPTQEAKRAILDAAWQKQWDDQIASLTRIEWEVLTFAAKTGVKNAFDILSTVSRYQQGARVQAIRRLMTLDLLRNVHSLNGFGSISDDGHRALRERAERMAQLTKANRGS